MKIIYLKVEVPDDAEMFSVSYRLPIDPYGLLGYTFEYRRDRNPEVVTLPTEEEINDLPLPDFLYENNNEIYIGYHGDSICTDVWNKWLNEMTCQIINKIKSQ